jgi:hypothetical protein
LGHRLRELRFGTQQQGDEESVDGDEEGKEHKRQCSPLATHALSINECSVATVRFHESAAS